METLIKVAYQLCETANITLVAIDVLSTILIDQLSAVQIYTYRLSVARPRHTAYQIMLC